MRTSKEIIEAFSNDEGIWKYLVFELLLDIRDLLTQHNNHDSFWFEEGEFLRFDQDEACKWLNEILTTHSQPDKSKEEELADKVHSMFASAYAIGEKVNHEWLVNVLTTHSQNREAEIRKEERDRLRELVSRHAFSIYDENLPSPVVSEQILLEALTPEQLEDNLK